MLTATERKYLHVCLEHIKAPALTYDELGASLGIPARTVRRAVGWGAGMGVFDRTAADKLAEQVAEYRAHLHWLERERRIVLRAARDERGKRLPIHPFQLTALSREIREVRGKLAELEGLIKNVLAVEVGVEKGGRIVIERPADNA